MIPPMNVGRSSRIHVSGERSRLTTPLLLLSILLVSSISCEGDRGGAVVSDDATGDPALAIPRILVISVDTLRPDVLSPYDTSLGTTPRLQEFASDSVLFSDVIAQAASTAVSHKSLFTSLYPSIHKTTREEVPRAEVELPLETLQARGIRTVGFHAGGQISAKLGFGQGFDVYEEIRRLDGLGDRATEWLRANTEDPFFLFLHTYQMHCPYNPPEPHREKYADWYRGDVDPLGKVAKGNPGCPVSYFSRRDMSPDDYRFLRSLYMADAAYMDVFVGRVIDTLKALGLYDRTLIVFTSDHAESFGEHDFVGHNRFYNVVLRVPLIIRLPGTPSARVNAPVEMFDIMPTVFDAIGAKVFDAIGAKAPYAFQGRSLLPLLRDPAKGDPLRTRISEHKIVTVQEGAWKLRFDRASRRDPHLVNLEEDPEEERNRIEERPAIAERLMDHYVRMRHASEDLSGFFSLETGNDAQIDRELEERLRALGYVD